MAEDSGQERSEAPTQRRLQQARDSGQLPVSRELTVFAGLAAVTMMLAWNGASGGDALVRDFGAIMEHAAAREADPAGVALAVLTSGLRLALPLVAGTAAAGAAAILLQTGGALSLARLAPNIGRLNPIAGFGRLFGMEGLGEAGRSILKLGLIGFALWRTLIASLPALPGWPFPDPGLLAADLGTGCLHLLEWILLIQALVAVLDVIWVRMRFTAGLRMSKQEVKEENKETEGDPRIKMRIRRLRMTRARRRMLAAVPKATVVVTNPTHYAVALAYDRNQPAAPRVVAKGVDSMAERIRAIAREHRVPLIPNPPLARALHRLELDREIPAEHYKAVAEIIAYVWRLRDQVRAAVR